MFGSSFKSSLGTVQVAETQLTIAATSSQPPGHQPSPGARLDTGDDRLQSASLAGGRIYAVLNDRCRPVGDSTTCRIPPSVEITSDDAMM